MKTKSLLARCGRRTGFTLIEIILVLSIIALLLGVGIANLDGVFGRGKTVKARSDIAVFHTGLKAFLMDAGVYPDQSAGLGALRRAPATGRGSRAWAGPYMERMPLDPWGKPYQYRHPGERIPGVPDVFSMGADGVAASGDDVWPKEGAGDEAY